MTIRPVPLGTSVGRIPVVDVSPVAEAGRFPAKAVVGEAVPVRATVFREGHDAVAATAVLTDPVRRRPRERPDGRHRARAGPLRGAPGADEHGRLDVPRRGLVGPVRHVGARRHDQGRGRRRRRADARRGRPAARAGGGAHGCRRDVEGGRPGPQGRGHGAARHPRHPAGAARGRAVRQGARGARRAPAARLGDALAGLPADGRPPARPRRLLVRAVPALAGRQVRPRGREVACRARCARRPLDLPRIAGHGLRRRLPDARAPHRRDLPQGPEQLAVRGPGRPGLAVRDRLPRGRARRDRADAGHVRRLRRVRRRGRGTWAWRWRSTSRCSAPPTTRG